MSPLIFGMILFPQSIRSGRRIVSPIPAASNDTLRHDPTSTVDPPWKTYHLTNSPLFRDSGFLERYPSAWCRFRGWSALEDVSSHWLILIVSTTLQPRQSTSYRRRQLYTRQPPSKQPIKFSWPHQSSRTRYRSRNILLSVHTCTYCKNK